MILIVDGNATAYRSKYTSGDLMHMGEYTGVIYGFFTQVLTMLNKYRPDQICFAWDSRSSFRKEIYPEYKAKRNKSKRDKTEHQKTFDNVCYDQFYTIQEEILPSIGFVNNFKIKGYEGDDLIASICKYNKGKKIVATSDNDMYQLLNDETSIYDLGTKKHFTEGHFRQKYGIEPIRWVDVKMIAGCHSDEVIGIQGVGMVTVLKYLTGDLKPTQKAFQKIESLEGNKIKRTNVGLVKLPFEGTPKIELQKDNIDLNKMKSIFMDYGFQSLIQKERFDIWKILKG